MPKRILITRDDSGNVQFETVTIVDTDNVFFLNLDTEDSHQPSIMDPNEIVGPAPSLPSSQCIPEPTYTCLIPGHGNESGDINIVSALAPVNATALNVVELKAAIRGQPITRQQVMAGGKSPYSISDQFFEITDSNDTVIQKGPSVGPGLQVSGTPDDDGVWVSGTPTVSGTYTFSFSVSDAAGTNVQQVQYRMLVN
jgi:hypothetical protein